MSGISRVEPIPKEWHRYAKFRSTLWSPLPVIDYSQHDISRREILQFDEVTLIALCAAHEAIERSGLTLSVKDRRARTFAIDTDASRTGVYIGTGIGGARSFATNYAYHMLSEPKSKLLRFAKSFEDSDASLLDSIAAELEHPPRFNPFVVSRLMPNATAAALGIKFSVVGPNQTCSLACASGTAAIGEAFHAIRRGEVDVALSGGCEYLRDPYGGMFRGFDAAGTLVLACDEPALANRPFDRARSGFLFSEGGACVLVLEELTHAEKRGSTPIAEVVGYGTSFDAYNMMASPPDGRQIENMFRRALDDADISFGDVQYINGHGTGTESNDRLEAKIIRELFGQQVFVNSTKSLLGHTIGASGALEALVCALSLNTQKLHGSPNLDDPVDDLHFVTSTTAADFDIALTHSFAFGGHNAALILRCME